MSYYTRSRQLLPGAKKVKKSISEMMVHKYAPDQPRDKTGRWVAVSLGRSTFGIERVRGERAVGRGEDTYPTMAKARAAAKARNSAPWMNVPGLKKIYV